MRLREAVPQLTIQSLSSHLCGDETTLGKMERQVCSQEGQKPSSNECSCQEEIVGHHEGPLGPEEGVGGGKLCPELVA